MKKLLVPAALLLVWASAQAAPPSRGATKYEFSSAVTAIQFEGISGNISIVPAEGTSGEVKLRASVRPSRNFRPEVEQDGNTLYINEHWESGSSNGSVDWLIYLPKTQKPLRIKVSTASGELICKDINARISFSTASGNIELAGVALGDGSNLSTASGDIILHNMTVDEGSEFSTASGDVELEGVTISEGCGFSTASGNVRSTGCKGYFELSSASGNVEVRDCEVAGRSKFSTASGGVNLYLTRLPDGNMTASSASGDVRLDVAEFGDNFTLVLVAREDEGEISCPFDYTSEDTYEDGQGNVYEEKTVERGTGRPEISLSTASGEVVVKK